MILFSYKHIARGVAVQQLSSRRRNPGAAGNDVFASKTLPLLRHGLAFFIAKFKKLWNLGGIIYV
jgi:hypothetical protein